MGMFVSIWRVCMLRLKASGPESLFDELLPDGVSELPADLAALDLLLADPVLLEPITARWRAEVQQTGRSVISDGRPTIAMETYVRMMVLKMRHGWGYRTLVAAVSDSIHLRRFCLIALCECGVSEPLIERPTFSTQRLTAVGPVISAM